MTEGNHCKLADFGLVFDLTNSPRSRAIEGDSRYLAPELMQGNYLLANDIFSLGITLLELASGLELPANGELWQELRSLILPEAAMDTLSPELQQTIRSMMEPDPTKRPTVDQLLQVPRLKALKKQRKVAKVLTGSVSFEIITPEMILFILFFLLQTRPFIQLFDFLKFYLILSVCYLRDFWKLRSNRLIPAQNKVSIVLSHYNEDSDDGDTSIRTSLNSSRVSKISADEDNNNKSNVTPTLNNSIPRVTPEVKIVNSTPLNHYNHQDSLSNRKYRRDLTKMR